MTPEERLNMEVLIYNDSDGDLNEDGISCEKCKNKGYIMTIIDGYKTLEPCTCMAGRKSRKLIKKSGIEKLLSLYTFETYKCEFKWQYDIKTQAFRFVDQVFLSKWFYVGGQSGSGKTHICTAILSRLIDKGIEVRYMLWRDDIAKIKAVSFGDGSVELMNTWKTIQVLYIDDFFKSDTKPSPTDVNIAFEILNYRYNNKMPTLISSEYTVDVILSIDEAIGSRIVQMCGSDFRINVPAAIEKNHRLKKENADANRQ
ncbi:MAG: hypothetical protein A2Y16_05525 [Tenericutes bacterium GWF2_57_13]|nr:MAG: hypothetical protein A2Y16_05525 [Tenericutes bacterium GWF2_57_13]